MQDSTIETSDTVEIVTVDASNVAERGFFCRKSKPGESGYNRKLEWLGQRFSEGLMIKILYENDRSVGFIEYVPGESSWRAVSAPDYTVIHCIWVVGRAKNKGYGARLLNECIDDARRAGRAGVAMVASTGIWLAGPELFPKNGFELVAKAPPTFELLVKRFDDAPLPSSPTDWDHRLSRWGPGLTVVYSDQCPYIIDDVQLALDVAGERGVEARAVRLESSEEARELSPSPYGVFGMVYDGKLLSYHYELRQDLERLLDSYLP